MKKSPDEQFTKAKLSDKPTRTAINALIKRYQELTNNLEEGEVLAADWAVGAIKQISDKFLRDSSEPVSYGIAMLHVVADLLSIGWLVTLKGGHLYVAKPESGTVEAIRKTIVTARDRSLLKPSTQDFINKMEGWRSFQGKQVSIFTLMEDGRELLDRMLAPDVGDQEPIRPYIQLATAEKRCKQTGIPLLDIWRYFRLTWSSPHESVPGRSAQFIVRDAASQHHAVIGIFALSSAAVRLEARDQYIGWDNELLVADIEANPSVRMAKWVFETLGTAKSEIYVGDFRERDDKNVDFKKPAEAIETLLEIAEENRELHKRLSDKKKTTAQPHLDWQRAAKTELFRAKRAEQYAKLLRVEQTITELAGDRPSKKGLTRLASSPTGRKALSDLISIARAKTVGTAIADLTVCGAVAPYNHLAGGKLVALMATSPETVNAFNKRYADSVSVIASSIAGEEIVRPSELAFVGTTSLYGKRPNQYDRIAFPTETAGGEAGSAIRYRHLKRSSKSGAKTSNTKGMGSFHFSAKTLQKLEEFCRQNGIPWGANRVFGEGTSPKLRGIRDGLHALGLDADCLLKHGIERCVYGVSLSKNTRDYLLGINKRPQYLLPLKLGEKATKAMTRWWTTRWAFARLAKSHVRDSLAKETLTYPIIHGARVPNVGENAQIDLLQ